ncbi:MAG: transcription termination/antitermination NusG family protein [Verrucomicrobiales bacterium]|nr:transcription termination/antitermination NusG family protein [Verrucomicrobiales bacterium]
MLQSSQEAESGWFCVRTKPKTEHVAARNLLTYAKLEEVFCPRIRYEKATRRGKAWFVEALFPGYIFAKFNLIEDLRTVNATTNVTGVLRFADRYPTIEDALITALQGEFPEEDGSVRVLETSINEGDEVVIDEGVLKGMTTIVSRISLNGDRVAVLMDWLGQEREVEVSVKSISPVDGATRVLKK